MGMRRDQPLVPENEIGISKEEPKPSGRHDNQRDS